jgi:hypothetical protein
MQHMAAPFSPYPAHSFVCSCRRFERRTEASGCPRLDDDPRPSGLWCDYFYSGCFVIAHILAYSQICGILMKFHPVPVPLSFRTSLCILQLIQTVLEKQAQEKKIGKRLKMFVSVILSASFIEGCETYPDKIAPAYVSPLQYSNCDCDQIRMELMRVNAKVMEVAGVQERTTNKDSAAMAVGLILFWPALFFLASGDSRKEELARLKGDYDCLEKTWWAALRLAHPTGLFMVSGCPKGT